MEVARAEERLNTLRSRACRCCRGLRAHPEHPFEQLTQQLGTLAEQIEQLVAIELQGDAAAQNIGGLAERLSRACRTSR